MKIKKDGDMWCVTKDDFINLQESEALFITDEEYKAFITSIKQEAELKGYKDGWNAYKNSKAKKIEISLAKKEERKRMRKELEAMHATSPWHTHYNDEFYKDFGYRYAIREINKFIQSLTEEDGKEEHEKR